MFFLPIVQPLAPCRSRLLCSRRGCPSCTLYGDDIITAEILFVNIKRLPKDEGFEDDIKNKLFMKFFRYKKGSRKSESLANDIVTENFYEILSI